MKIIRATRWLLALACFGAWAKAGAQTQYSIGNPTNEQQYMLELINRARANGGTEALRLGLSGLQEGSPSYNGETWTIQNVNQPLSWNPLLFNAAQNQAVNLNNGDQIFLSVSPHTYGGMTPQQRIAGAGFGAAAYNGPTTNPSHAFPGPENVAEAVSQGSGPYTGAKLIAEVLSAHNDLFTDQNTQGRGHRNTTMLGFFREIGIGISTGKDNQASPGQPNGPWDSLYIVQDFGTQSSSTPFITGVIYQDLNGNGFYDPGEGIGGVRISVPGSNFFAISSSSGGYSVPVPGNGTYNVSFSGGSVDRQQSVTVGGGLNAKANCVTNLAPATKSLGNISTRLPVSTGDNVLIGGFIVTGTQPKKVIIRAIGPSMTLSGKLADPILELHGPGGLIATNDNWRTGAQEAEIIASTVPPPNNLEPAIVATLPANATGYTAIVRGVGGGTGIGSVEIYDLDRSVDSKLANISSRGFVQTGDNVMIGGFIVVGGGAQKVIIRAIGPSLSVPGKLADPTLELFNENGVSVATNDNWRTGGQQAEIIASTVPPPNDLEAAIVATLPPALHTAIVRGKNGGIGVAVVEVYALD